MSSIYGMRYDEQQQLRRELVDDEQEDIRLSENVQQMQSDIINEIVHAVPHVDAEIAVPLSQEVLYGTMSLDQAIKDARDSVQLIATQGFENAVRAGMQGARQANEGRAKKWLKNAVKYGSAVAEFLPQLAVSSASTSAEPVMRAVNAIKGEDLYQGPSLSFLEKLDPRNLVATTDLGQILTGAESGNGYFIGEEAAQQQQEAAKAYRGTIDGEGWTFGRGYAYTLLQDPNSQAYNIGSGYVDAITALAIPSAPGSAAVKTAASAGARAPLTSTITGAGRTAEEAAQIGEQVARKTRTTLALPGTRRKLFSGTTYAGRTHIDRSTVNPWISSKEGQQTLQKMREIDTVERVQDAFPNTGADFHQELLDAAAADRASGTVEELSNLTRRRLGLEGLSDVREIRLGRGSDARRELIGIQNLEPYETGSAIFPTYSSIKAKSQSFFARNFATVPGQEMIIVSNDIRDLTRTVKNASDYLKTLKIPPQVREDVLSKLQRALLRGQQGRGGEIDEATRLLDDVIIKKLVADHTERTPFVAKPDDADIEKLYRKVFSNFRNDVGEYALYGRIDETGHPLTPSGFNFQIEGDGFVLIRPDGTLVGPTAHIPSEVRKFGGYMPDARKLRRLSSDYGFLWKMNKLDPETWGDPGKLQSFLQAAQQDVWRPATLMTGGYMFRNMLESVVRAMTAPGIQAGMTNPIEWLMVASKRKQFGDVNGVDFAEDAPFMARRTSHEYVESMNARPREAKDILDIERAAFRSGHYKLVARPRPNDPSDEYIQGVANELRLLANTASGRVAANVLAETGDPVETRRVLREWFTGEIDESSEFLDAYGLRPGQGADELDTINKLWTNKRIQDEFGIEGPGSIRMFKLDGTPDLENIDRWIDNILLLSVNKITAGQQSLLQLVGNAAKDAKFVNRNGEYVDSFLRASGLRVFEIEGFQYSNEMIEEISALHKAGVEFPAFVKMPQKVEDMPWGKVFDGNKLGTYWKKTVDHFFGHVFAKKEAFLNRSPVFRQFYYLRLNQIFEEVTQEAASDIVNNIRRNVVDAKQQRVDELKRVKANEYGIIYWQGKEITKQRYKELLFEARSEVRKAKELPDNFAVNYIGDAELWQRIQDRANGVTQHTSVLGEGQGLSLEQVDIALKSFAADQTKRVFFNAADKSNFADILRIVVPFGPAWAEMVRFYGREVLPKPNRLKNMAVTVQGVRDMDPDGDGKSFVYTDPNTREQVFNYPFGSWAIPLMQVGAGAILGETFFGRNNPLRAAAVGATALGAAGFAQKEFAESRLEGGPLGDVKPMLTAPVKSLSMSFNVVPGVGPVIQMAAEEVLGSKPSADRLMQFISPYGSPQTIREFAPAWLRKVFEAISADPISDKLYGDLKMDAYRALLTTGKYGTFGELTSEDKARLRSDAEDVAASLLAFRGFAQFLGPVRGTIRFNIPTKWEGTINIDDEEYKVDGEYISNVLLASTFRAMQEEDYENAVVDFLRAFGPHVMLYTAGKTRTTVEGLDASKEFGVWARNNSEIVESFSNVYGYFADVGTEFDLQTYLTQIERGERERITDPNVLQQIAEEIVGKALYVDRVRMMSRNPTDFEKEELKEYRLALGESFPGFANAPLNIRENQQILAEVEEAVRSPLLSGNKVASAAREYFTVRDQMLQEARKRKGNMSDSDLLKGRAVADLRRVLRETADRLIARTPEFARLYNRVLFDEVDL